MGPRHIDIGTVGLAIPGHHASWKLCRSLPPIPPAPPCFSRLTGIRPGPTLRRSRRAKLLIATSIVAVGLMAGTGVVALSTTASTQANAAATASALKEQQKQYDTKLVRAQTVFQADATLGHANQVLASAQNKVDATPLATSVASLANYESLDTPTVLALAKQTSSAATQTQAATAEADRVAAEQAAAAAAEAAAQAAAKAAALAAAGNSGRRPRRRARHGRRRSMAGTSASSAASPALAEGVGLVVHRVNA